MKLRKIDIYLKTKLVFTYNCTTQRFKTLKAAKQHFCEKYLKDPKDVRVMYSKEAIK